ncbi:MAG: cell division protein FtsH [Candidatus Omnitrophica bacterium CG1_02_49_16]|uniref:ATP-dependent zinc metalloprotease FtsH n=1 Tax=Candidatus Falkowbacteria bacterium CG10_big_fil_rev_8_21_14_0_10_43_11 TaxID=1974568 RepID=A0A2M6WN19_9BACT|nr:MAG: cell division protein FtsH [Candidatus Omnitrophica bacterium CG1_02_49_16]PIT94185.1 MAG: cell division protein FtsH [Candidatus Falkowbacteria bacterium CG10_big_fil_rev_8_21_14_0_10_43_11]
MKNLLKNFFIFFIILLVVSGLFYSASDAEQPKDYVGIQKLVEEINGESVESVTVEGNLLRVKLKDGSGQKVKKENGESLSALLKNFSVAPDKLAKVNIEVKDESGLSFWASMLLPIALPLLLIGVFIYFMARQIQGANVRALMFGQSQAREVKQDQDKKKQITFKDVAGVKEAKEELKEVVEFLTSPKKFLELGANIPKGVLLVGAPGTGKTLLAKAVAGEAHVPFFHMSGSEFVEMFVGVGASRVRDLFKRAKKSAPCIVFIDEIDAVGRQRGSGLGGSHDEREQTLNQILVEMDGFEPNTNVIVIAATNRPDVLDPALLRPGRFDRRVVLDEPDINDRTEILKVHSQKKPLGKEVSLRRIAERTPGFSGADLANLLNEAAILSARNGKRLIEMPELFQSIEKVMLGPERKSRVLSDKEKKITAYHEAGHALVTHILPNTDPVQKISIISRGMAGGYTLKVPLEDKRMHSRQEFLEELSVLLGGYIAEREIFGDITTGATSDLRTATHLARRMITDYGMSRELGPRTFGSREELIFLGRELHEQRDYSEKIAERIDDEIMHYLNEAAERARQIIREHKPKLEKIVEALLKQEKLEKEEFEELVKA